MPNFFIVGAQKAGTTSLYHYLDQHPEVYMSPRKEPHFFEGMHSEFRRPGLRSTPISDLADYQVLFAGASGERAIGEASASYLYSPRAPGLIKSSVSDARIIIILRNPAERAYSNYLHCVQVGREPLGSFADALRAEESRMREKWGPLWYYRHKGFYYPQVERYFDVFGRDRVGVWLHEDLRNETQSTLGEVFRFLGVDESFVPDASVEHNPSGVPRIGGLYKGVRAFTARNPILVERVMPAKLRGYVKGRLFTKPPPFPPELRQDLTHDYKEDVLKLQGLIGRDLSAWLDGAGANRSV
jgi:Sulfotransferase family